MEGTASLYHACKQRITLSVEAVNRSYSILSLLQRPDQQDHKAYRQCAQLQKK